MICRLDHVNIVTLRLEETVRFYTEVLGMRSGNVAGLPPGSVCAAWIYDDSDTPVLHLQGIDPGRPEEALESVLRRRGDLAASISVEGLRGSGAIDHIALECDRYDELRARLTAAKCELNYNEVPRMNLRQIFVNDPNGITLELNFRG